MGSDESPSHRYDVALSFAGEQRDYVEQVAQELRLRGLRPFYDAYEQATLWGKDLYEHLDYVYRRAARYCIVFASEAYAGKMWAAHERKSAQARAIEDNAEYVLPARFDETEIPGIRPTVGHVDLRRTSPTELARLVAEKVGPRPRSKFYPPVPDRLLNALGVLGANESDYAYDVARSFFGTLERTTREERKVIWEVFHEGCTSELPDNVHINLDLARRALDMPPAEILETLRGMSSIGFDVRLRYDGDEEHGDQELVEVRWIDLVTYDEEDKDDYASAFSTAVACEMIDKAIEGYCLECGLEAVLALDFAGLSSVTDDAAEREHHLP